MAQVFSGLGTQNLLLLQDKNSDISRIVGRRTAKFSNLGVSEIRNQKFFHYCEILFHFAVVVNKRNKATLVA